MHTVTITKSQMSRAQLIDITIDAGARSMSEAKEFGQALSINLRFDEGMSQQRFEFGTKEDGAATLSIIERFHAEMITSEEQALLVLIPEAEGKDTVQATHTSLTPLSIGMKEHFGIGARTERMAEILQFAA